MAPVSPPPLTNTRAELYLLQTTRQNFFHCDHRHLMKLFSAWRSDARLDRALQRCGVFAAKLVLWPRMAMFYRPASSECNISALHPPPAPLSSQPGDSPKKTETNCNRTVNNRRINLFGRRQLLVSACFLNDMKDVF